MASAQTPTLPDLPGRGERPLPPWPAQLVEHAGSALFVRHAEGAFVEAVRASEPRELAVFVHGLGGASTNWTDLMALLAPWLDGYAPDLPGFGRSEPRPDARYSIGAFVESLHGFLTSLDGPVHLFGNSLGGVVATRFAARYPDLVRSLTLVSPAVPSFRPPAGLGPLGVLAMLPGVGTLLRRRLGEPTPEQRAGQLLDLSYYDSSRLAPERRREAVEEMTARSRLAWDMPALTGATVGLVRSYLVPPSRSVWRDAASVRVPVLLIWGRHDRLVPVDLSDRAQRTYPQSRLVVVEDSGHVSQMEKPRETAQAVLDFLAPGCRR